MRAILGRIGLLSALLARAHGITSGSALGPASSPKPRCRLFVESSPLQAGVRVQLSEGQQHYLMSVMRVSDQATVLLFDGHSGEWLARINREGRRGCTSTPLEQTRPQPSSPAVIALHFALLKPKRLAQLVEKATELGVTQLQVKRKGFLIRTFVPGDGLPDMSRTTPRAHRYRPPEPGYSETYGAKPT